MAASFRDPGGRLLTLDGRIIRLVTESGAADLRAWLQSDVHREMVCSRQIVASKVLTGDSAQQILSNGAAARVVESMAISAIVEHERIPFPSFPYEWPPEMLHAAGMLTLEIATQCLGTPFGLKDGTPYNVLFDGSTPRFIDVLSFEQRHGNDGRWLAYAQYIRTFVLPLLVNRCLGIPIDQLLLARRDGLEPEAVYGWIGPIRRLTPPFLSLVSIPKWLGGVRSQDDTRIYQRRLESSPEKAQFILGTLFGQLRRAMLRLRPRPQQASVWSAYMTADHNNYSDVQFAEKEAFVRQALQEFIPDSVLDIGANTGHFSRLAAAAGARVVAINYNPVVVGRLWSEAQEQGLNILPLVVNLARPTPPSGWRSAECPSFLSRARGAFEAVLFLAVLHHLLITERVPLDDVMDLAAELTTGIAVIEFVEPSDSMFRRLTRGRDHLHANLSVSVFEGSCRRHFEVVRSARLTGGYRHLYLLKKKRA